ncbi:protein-L-isoaspartate(D-aspartate) O-methyltransferase [Hoeflea sp.]|uniref:protein-L-isoaspartate(D-aspartate) O-methyltransferase n=1 Tax=Hoeflea sp. TaxID=1940281 RepID=UPI003B023FDC
MSRITTDFERQRKQMVAGQIRSRGLCDTLVLAAMENVPREAFVPEQYRFMAYDDGPLPIGEGQTISQPYMVAFMVEALALKGGETVLEIGAGSGYAAAVLAEIAEEVYAVERIGALAGLAARNLAETGYDNVHVSHADGTRGLEAHAPYDAILVSAGAPDVPETLKGQLAAGGRIVLPVGSDRRSQSLVRITKTASGEFEREVLADVRFVPLIGAEGWDELSWPRTFW